MKQKRTRNRRRHRLARHTTRHDGVILLGDIQQAIHALRCGSLEHVSKIRYVSGHDFSRAKKRAWRLGL
jgi:hypothetical protein